MIKLIHDRLAKLLPESVFIKLKQRYRRFKGKHQAKISEKELRRFLTEKLGLVKGDSLFIHSSTISLFFDFPFTKIITILLEIVGEEGTLLFPTSQLRVRAEDYLKDDPIFDVRKTKTEMGFLPEYARRLRHSFRSLHPTNSVVAIGKNAQLLTNEHHKSIYPCGEQSPYYKIMEYNGKYIGIGVRPENTMTFIHTVEDVLKDKFPIETRAKQVYKCKVIDKEGKAQTVETLVGHERIKHRNLKRFFKKYIDDNIMKTYVFNGAPYYTADSVELYKRMLELAQKGKTVYTKEAFCN